MFTLKEKIATLLLVSLFAGLTLNAQDEQKPKVDLYGFLRNEFYYDTYKGVDAAMDQFYLVPLYVGKDANGAHINQQGSAHLTAIATRVGANITGSNILGAKPMGNIEIDFAGVTSVDPVLIRIRKAYLKLSWEKSAILVGQNWHPFWGGACFPSVAGLNTGAPFQPFNRSPQVNFDYKLGKTTLSATALYENQYVSKGFYTTTNSNNATLPKRNAGIPELVLSATYQGENITLGAAGQHNTIQPIDKTTANDKTYITNEVNNSMAAMVYGQYKTKKFKLLVKSIYGQNLANLTMLGGYGVKSVDGNTGAYTYTNYNHIMTYTNAVYGQTHQLGLFAGMTKNLGTSDALVENTPTAGLLTNIQNLYRLSVHYAYNVKNFRFVAEYENTTAAYGTGTMNTSDGLYTSSESVTNNRLIFVVMYMF
ncbi:MAG: hypothetical protein JXR50_12355 [Prolixibacteraceae bacterium]|nr:hypothetical protein [Prolixibacteraceae bacterium]MBN2650525.1 hypothetical protein [Prolixibacteraceae bacterium]